MVSLVLFSVAIAGVLSVAVTMSGAFRDQRAIVATESSARSPMDYLTDVLRNASPGVQSGLITDWSATGAACTTPAALRVTNNNPGPLPAAGTDSVEVIYAAGGVVTSSRASWSSGSLTVMDGTGFAVGDYIVVTDTNTGQLAQISSVSGATSPATLGTNPLACTTNMPGGGYPSGSIVIRAMHAKFFVDNTTVDNIPNLMMGLEPNSAAPPAAEPVSDGIEDLQVALGIDWNPTDNAISENGAGPDDDEWLYNVTGDTAQPVLLGPIRSLRLTMIARAVNANVGVTNANTYFRPKAEDHAASGAGDPYRRRVLQSTIEIRNLGGSP
jgi:hypothetical protein